MSVPTLLQILLCLSKRESHSSAKTNFFNSFLLQAATVPQEVVMELPVLIIAQQCLLQCVAPMEKRTATSVLWK